MKKIILLAFIVSCGHKTGPKPPIITDADRLKTKAAFYISHADLDEAGWIKDTKCDGLLFNSLYNLGGGISDPSLARSSSGVWLRYHNDSCYPGGSGSSISRDMFAGLYLWIFHQKSLDLIQEIIDYGKAHTNNLGGWVMGAGDPFAISIRIEGQAMAFLLDDKLGGRKYPLENLPEVRFDLDGYEEHLQELDILLRSLLLGAITDGDLKAAKHSAEKEPRNALFQAIYHKYSDGDQTVAIKILLDESIFPSDRLPSSSDRCEMYLWQRTTANNNPDWLPCSTVGKIFSGVDYLFAKAVILNEI